MLASGYSQNRTAAITGVPQQTISDWLNVTDFSPQFTRMVQEMQVQFLENRESVLKQSEALALLLYHQGLTGERDDVSPIELALELLRNTVWKQRAGGHKQFGAS